MHLHACEAKPGARAQWGQLVARKTVESEGGFHLCLTEIPCLLWDEVVTILSSFES